MIDNNWDPGPDEEELFELAMQDRQYRDYKSGVARSRFEGELAKAREQASGAKVIVIQAPVQEPVKEKDVEPEPPKIIDRDVREIVSPAKSQIIYKLFGEDFELSTPGERISAGERLRYIQTAV